MKFQYRQNATNRNRQIVCFAWCNANHEKTPPLKPEQSEAVKSRPVNALVKALVS